MSPVCLDQILYLKNDFEFSIFLASKIYTRIISTIVYGFFQQN